MTVHDDDPRTAAQRLAAYGPLAPPETISLVRLLNVPLRGRARILRWALGLAVLAGAAAALRPREYRSAAAFFPQGSRLPNNVAGLAAQFGVNVPTGGETARTPDFYAELLGSHDLLAALVARPFEFGEPRRKATLTDLFGAPWLSVPGLPAPSAGRRRERAIAQVVRRLHVEVSEKTGVVDLSVTTPDPGLSRDVAVHLLEAVSRFNQQTRRSQAGAERQFAETRLAAARVELRRAEDRLQYFLESNRELGFAPSLQFQRARLNDEVSVQRQLVLTLTQNYEQARLDEVRDTPVITVMDVPDVASRPEPRRVPIWAAVGLLLGAAIGAAVTYVREYLEHVRRDDAEGFAQFQSLRSDLARELRMPTRLLRGPAGEESAR